MIQELLGGRFERLSLHHGAAHGHAGDPGWRGRAHGAAEARDVHPAAQQRLRSGGKRVGNHGKSIRK